MQIFGVWIPANCRVFADVVVLVRGLITLWWVEVRHHIRAVGEKMHFVGGRNWKHSLRVDSAFSCLFWAETNVLWDSSKRDDPWDCGGTGQFDTFMTADWFMALLSKCRISGHKNKCLCFIVEPIINYVPKLISYARIINPGLGRTLAWYKYSLQSPDSLDSCAALVWVPGVDGGVVITRRGRALVR